MDQAEFAALAGTSRSTISRLENDRTTLRAEQIARLESELNLSIHEALQITALQRDWLGDYLQLEEKQRAAVDEVITAAVRAIKGLG